MELNFLFLDFYILSMSITNMITVIKNIKQFQIFIRYDTFGFRNLYINHSVDSVICQLPQSASLTAPLAQGSYSEDAQQKLARGRRGGAVKAAGWGHPALRRSRRCAAPAA